MHEYEIFSIASLRELLETGSFPGSNGEPDPQSGVVAVTASGARYWALGQESARARRVFIRTASGFSDLSKGMQRATLERLSNLAERARTRPLRVPTTWHAWNDQDRGLVSYYAVARGRIGGNPRAVVRVNLEGGDILLWDLAPDDRSTRELLAELEVDLQDYYDLVSRWGEVVTEAARVSTAVGQESGSSSVQLESIRRERSAKPKSYEEWVNGAYLTPSQRSFVENNFPHSVRLKGPAGSGKTLALELRALRERQLNTSGDFKVLFATHSWAMTEQVQSDLAGLNPSQAAEITVLPLLEVVRDIRPPASDLEILGTDSEEGREWQQVCVAMVVSEFLSDDWVTFRGRCPDDFVLRLEATASGEPGMLRDLATEFSVVIGGAGIQDGPRDEQRYLELDRGPWVMDLGDAARRAVYAMYRRFLTATRASGSLTSDQFMTTSLNWFKDFEWGALRSNHGFDLVLVDELHLFNSQERGVLNYLGRDPRTYPRLLMSVDSLQSTTGRFGSPASDAALDVEQEFVELKEIHRFSPEILTLIKHINLCIPTEDFGDQWGLDLQSAISLAPHGPRPSVVDAGDTTDEVTAALREASSAVRTYGRVAVVVIDDAHAERFLIAAEGMTTPKGAGVSVIRTRDDLGTLNYSGRGIVVGRVEDLAGLQFPAVVLAGLGDTSDVDQQENRRLVFMSRLYLGASRACDHVSIVTDASAHGVPSVVKDAVSAGIALAAT